MSEVIIIGCPVCPAKLSITIPMTLGIGPPDVVQCSMCGREWDTVAFSRDHAAHVQSELDGQQKELENTPQGRIEKALKFIEDEATWSNDLNHVVKILRGEEVA